jgi:hypothetical protein
VKSSLPSSASRGRNSGSVASGSWRRARCRRCHRASTRAGESVNPSRGLWQVAQERPFPPGKGLKKLMAPCTTRARWDAPAPPPRRRRGARPASRARTHAPRQRGHQHEQADDDARTCQSSLHSRSSSFVQRQTCRVLTTERDSSDAIQSYRRGESWGWTTERRECWFARRASSLALAMS